MSNHSFKQGHRIIVPENKISSFLFSDTRSAWIWLIIRLYLGCVWLMAGWHKIFDEAWTGSKAGAAVSGFVQGALAKAEEGGDVSGWYASFLESIVLPNAKLFSYLVAYGE